VEAVEAVETAVEDAMPKTALVTGASGGIGLAIARSLAADGYQLTLVARSSMKELLAQFGSGHREITADLSKPADFERVAADVKATKYDVLINNAGIGVYGRFEEQSLESLQAMMRLNMDSLVALTHTFLKTAKAGDSVINVASTLALVTFPGASVYAATKAFVTSFSECLWWENKPRDVYVAALLPGVTKTNFHAAAGGEEGKRPPENITQTPEEVAAVCMSALKSRSSPTVVSGFTNKAMIFFTNRLLPRSAMVNIMGKNSPLAK
jgi:uncharacterized protein